MTCRACSIEPRYGCPTCRDQASLNRTMEKVDAMNARAREINKLRTELDTAQRVLVLARERAERAEGVLKMVQLEVRQRIQFCDADMEDEGAAYEALVDIDALLGKAGG